MGKLCGRHLACMNLRLQLIESQVNEVLAVHNIRGNFVPFVRFMAVWKPFDSFLSSTVYMHLWKVFCAQRTKVKRRKGFNRPAKAPKNARFNCTTFGYMLRNVQRFRFVGLNVAMYASIRTLQRPTMLRFAKTIKVSEAIFLFPWGLWF